MRDTIDDLKVRDAARDTDLEALYALEIYGETHAVPAKRAEFIEDMDKDQIRQLHQAISAEYDLSPSQMKRAIGHCVAGLVGVDLGADFFNG